MIWLWLWLLAHWSSKNTSDRASAVLLSTLTFDPLRECEFPSNVHYAQNVGYLEQYFCLDQQTWPISSLHFVAISWHKVSGRPALRSAWSNCQPSVVERFRSQQHSSGTGCPTTTLRQPIRWWPSGNNWSTHCSSSHFQTLSCDTFLTVTPIVVLAVALRPL